MRRSNRYTWMLNGWTRAMPLAATDGGTEFITIGVPDDFMAVRVGFANMSRTPWRVGKAIACASSEWSDYFNPLGRGSTPRATDAWSKLTFRHVGEDRAELVTEPDAPTEIIVAANHGDPTSDEPLNPSWTFTDWVSCRSTGADPTTGMRVLMLRALVPGAQTVTFTNGRMFQFTGMPALNRGYRCFTGGLKSGADFVTDPLPFAFPGLTTETVAANHLVDGQLMCLVQAMTRHAGVVGLLAGDSHQSGVSTVAGVNNFLAQSLFAIGEGTIGTVPVGIVNTAVGGLASRQIFPRVTALLRAARPGFVVLPGWSANEPDSTGYAGETAANDFTARMLFVADQVRDAGATPIFMTPLPRDAPFMNAIVRKSWLEQREFLLGLRDAGEFVLDATSLLGAMADGRFTGTYRDGLSSDTIHPNDTGHAAMAEVLTPGLRHLMGLS